MVCLITGASRGVGAATALRLATIGAQLTLVARTTAALEKIAEQVRQRGGQALVATADVSSAQDCARVTQSTLDRYGRLDTLICNAAVAGPYDKVSQSEPQAWERSIAVNLLGPYYLARAALPALRENRGRVIMIQTGAALQPLAGMSAYCASKAGLLHFTRVLAAEEPSVLSLSVGAGVVDTEMQEEIRQHGGAGLPPATYALFLQFKKNGVLVPAEAPARVIAWLATESSLPVPNGAYVECSDQNLVSAAQQFFK